MQSVARLVVSLAIVCVIAGCDETPGAVTNSDAETTSAAETVPASEELSLTEMTERLESIIDRGDVCRIFETINEMSLSYEDAEGLRSSLTVVWSALDEAHQMVPDDLADDWERLVTGTHDAISKLAAPDASVEDLRPVYSSSELMAAERRIDEWMADNCDA